MTHALVTGAHGFLGRHVALALAAAGWRVTGIGHGDWTEAEQRHFGIADWRSGDVMPSTLEAVGDAELIVHCAGSSSVADSIADPYADFVRTVTTTVVVLDYARRFQRPPRIVYPSSPAICGATTGELIGEDAPPNPISPYGMHKRMAEELCRFYAARYGVPTAIVRLFSVYGPGLRKQLLWDACTKIRRGEPIFFGTGDEVRDWLHVDDAVSLLLLAKDKAAPDSPIVNGGSGIGMNNRTLLRSLCELMVPGLAPSFSGAARAGDPPRYVADIARACGWGWRPLHALDTGLADYVRWFRELA